MANIQFDSTLIPVLIRSAVIARRAELGAVSELLFFDVLTDPVMTASGVYTDRLCTLAGTDLAAVHAAVRAEFLKRHPGAEWALDIPEAQEWPEDVQLSEMVSAVCFNAAMHVYAAGRQPGIIDLLDVLIMMMSVIPASLRDALAAQGFTTLALKMADAPARAPEGLIASLNLAGCDLFEDEILAITGEDEPEEDDEESEETADREMTPQRVGGDGQKSGEGKEAVSAPEDGTDIDLEVNLSPAEGQMPAELSEEELESYRKAMNDALGKLKDGALGSVIREMLENSNGKDVVSAAIVLDKDGNVVSTSLPGQKTVKADGAQEASSRPGRDMTREEKVLARFTRELTAEAERGDIDPLIGREAELDRIFEILCCRRKNKPLIIGETGTGKTAVVEGLARRIVEGKVPPFLRHARVFALNASSLSSRYKGVFGERIGEICEAVKGIPGGVLFIDDIHALVDGRDESALEQINALQRLVSDEKLRLIASTSFKPWRSTLSQNAAIARRLQPVELSAVSEEDAQAILRGLAPRFEAYHGVHFAEGVTDRAVTLASRYILDRALPDKAVDVLDELAAAARKNRETDDESVLEVTDSGLAAVIARMARIPVEQVGLEEGDELAHLGENLRKAVFGQDRAIEVLVNAIKMSRSGLGSAERPVGSFLFTGPTGVGKTEVARQLAESMHMPLLRFDMSEYSEAHTVSRLIGAPAGYVGYNEGGQLTEQVTKHPYSVVLLDEIEKAHPRLFNLLLQVMDHGKLTDSSGREADFRNVILIMTSNVGARALEQNVIGFGADTAGPQDDKAMQKAFSPEFRNRLDAIVRFKPLSHAVLGMVVDKFLAELTLQLSAKQVTPVYTEAFRAYLAEHGYDPHMGARPMRRLIADEVRKPLADELLFGRLKQGGKVTVDLGKNAGGRDVPVLVFAEG